MSGLAKDLQTLTGSFHNEQFEKREHLNAVVLLHKEVWKQARQCDIYIWCPDRKMMLVNKYLSPKFWRSLRQIEDECKGKDAKQMLADLKAFPFERK